MKLYYSKGACSLTVRILTHELGIACEFEAVDLKTKQTASGKDFLMTNPKGSVPAVILDNNELLTENSVILQYLADENKAIQLLPSQSDMQRYHVLEWLNFVSTELHKNCSPLFNPHISADLKQTLFVPMLKNKVAIVEKQLSKNAYLSSDQFTLADIYLFVVLRWLPHLTLNLSEWPHVERFFETVKNRSSVQLAMKEEGLV